MELTELEMLYMYRLVTEDIQFMKRRQEKYKKLAGGGYYEVEYQKKIALVEAELAAMLSVRGKLEDALALQDLLQVFACGGALANT